MHHIIKLAHEIRADVLEVAPRRQHLVKCGTHLHATWEGAVRAIVRNRGVHWSAVRAETGAVFLQARVLKRQLSPAPPPRQAPPLQQQAQIFAPLAAPFRRRELASL